MQWTAVLFDIFVAGWSGGLNLVKRLLLHGHEDNLEAELAAKTAPQDVSQSSEAKHVVIDKGHAERGRAGAYRSRVTRGLERSVGCAFWLWL